MIDHRSLRHTLEHLFGKGDGRNVPPGLDGLFGGLDTLALLYIEAGIVAKDAPSNAARCNLAGPISLRRERRIEDNRCRLLSLADIPAKRSGLLIC
jgi:hypothetical protein